MVVRHFVLAACAVACGRVSFDPLGQDGSGDGAAAITWRSTATALVLNGPGALSVTIDQPANCEPGTVMVAVVAMGKTANPTMPVFTPPSDWPLIRRIDEGNSSTLLLYWHATTSAEPATYTWGFDEIIEGVAWISCYSGVDTVSPVEDDAALLLSSPGPSYTGPTITTTTPSALLIGTFVAHAQNQAATDWTEPSATTPRASFNNMDSRSGLGVEQPLANMGPTGTQTATVSLPQEYALVDMLALRPGS